MADTHLGGVGVDYEAIDRDIDLVLATPGAYIIAVGDLLDNFIIGKLLALQMHTPFTINSKWALMQRCSGAWPSSPAVGGNHDNWTRLLAGIDLHDVHDAII